MKKKFFFKKTQKKLDKFFFMLYIMLGLRLLAIYVSIPKNQWLKIINGDENVSN